jgi:D-glycero-D-manno-heptose 1,7-bisphosphate phosphatase
VAPADTPRRKAVFLDRDGVINVDRHYVHRIEDFEFVAGTPQALRRLQRAGWLLVVITNQSGIARGFYTEADYQQLTRHMHETLRACGVVLDAVLHCPHLPDAQVPAYRRDCDCRKPGPGMLLQAADRLAIDLGSSALVGDRHTDLLAGRAAGVDRCILVRSGHPPDAPALAEADAVHDDLAAWVATLPASGAAPADTAQP